MIEQNKSSDKIFKNATKNKNIFCKYKCFTNFMSVHKKKMTIVFILDNSDLSKKDDKKQFKYGLDGSSIVILIIINQAMNFRIKRLTYSVIVYG